MNKFVLIEDGHVATVCTLLDLLEHNQDDDEFAEVSGVLLEGFPILLGGGAFQFTKITPLWSQTWH